MKINRYQLLFWVGFIIWITETWAFGWNATPKNNTEATLDMISGALMFVGVVGLITITAVKTAIRELEDE